MRIACFTNCYKPRINGVVRSISVYKDALECLGHEVHLFAPEAPGYVDTDPNVHRYPSLPWEDNTVYRLALPYSRALGRYIRNAGFDVVHAHHPIGLGGTAKRYARRNRIPLVYTVHSQYQAYGSYLHLGARLIERISRLWVMRYMRRCQRIIAPSDIIRRQAALDCPEAASRVVLLPSPLQMERYRNLDGADIRQRLGLDGQFTFVVATRLSAEKGLHDLINAYALVHRNHDDACLLILGDGPLREELDARVVELGLARNVVFAGMIPFEDIPRHLAAADAFVFASQVETQGLVLVEAMAAGLPVVAYDAPFIHDMIVHDVNGLLSRPNSQALAANMQALVRDHTLRQRLATHGHVTACTYDAPEMARRLVEVYAEAIDEYANERRARRSFGPFRIPSRGL